MEVKVNPDIIEFAKIIDGMYDLYVKKNSNYGNSFTKLWKDLGPISGLVPLHNKLDRLTNLVKGGKNDFESIEDTLIDLANYAIMNVIEMRRGSESFGKAFDEKSESNVQIVVNNLIKKENEAKNIDKYIPEVVDAANDFVKDITEASPEIVDTTELPIYKTPKTTDGNAIGSDSSSTKTAKKVKQILNEGK